MKNLDNFSYDLPPEFIADEPCVPRDQSKLLVLAKGNGKILHRQFFEIIEFLKKGDILVANNTKVFPARLLGNKKETFGKVEILLHKEVEDGLWEVIGKRLSVNGIIIFPNSTLEAYVESKTGETCLIRFNQKGEELFETIDQLGHTPIPPYINRPDRNEDRENYQTVYAKKRGSVAAPTAGLHFTEELIKKLLMRGIKIVEVTLHVGLGTFAPIKTENILEHKMHSEFYHVSKEAIGEIIKAKKEKCRVISIGTTTARVLETIFANKNIEPKEYQGFTDIFIYPGYKFHCIDGLITNFHLPKSTLLLLVSAFAGEENIKKAYREAIKKNYRFYSYGDAMMII